MRVDGRVEGREDLGTLEVIMKTGWLTRERGRHQRVTNGTNRKTQRPSENVAPCKGPELKVEKPSPGTGGEGQDRGGRRRKEEAQQTPKELST